MGVSLSNISHQALAFFPAPYGVLVVKIGMRSKRNLNPLSQKEGSVVSMIFKCSPRTWPSKIPPASFESNPTWMYRLSTSSGCSCRYTNCDYQEQPRALSAACWAPNVRQWRAVWGCWLVAVIYQPNGEQWPRLAIYPSQHSVQRERRTLNRHRCGEWHLEAFTALSGKDGLPSNANVK